MKTLATLALAVLLMACGSQAPKEALSKEQDSSFEKKFFSSNAFIFEVSVPATWHLSGKEVTDAINEMGALFLGEGDPAKEKLYQKALEQTENVFSIFEYEVGTPVNFNSNISCVVENIKVAPGVKTGADYLFHAARLLQNSQAKAKVDRSQKSLIINGKKFDRMDIDSEVFGIKSHQKFYATVIDGYAIVLISTAESESQSKTIDQLIKSIKILDKSSVLKESV